MQVASLDLLSPTIEKGKYGEKDIKDLATTRKTSKIKKIFDKFKGLKQNDKDTLMKNGDEIGDRS